MSKSTKRITLKDLAGHLGLSRTIISKVINNTPGTRVQEQTKQRILEAAREMNYHPLASARALATSKTRQIAFLLSAPTTLGLANNYYGMILAAANDECSKRDYQCMVNVYDLSSLEQLIMPDKLNQQSIDGLLLLGVFNNAACEKLADMNLPFVAVGGRPNKMVPVITRDLKQDFQKLLNYAGQLGHKTVWRSGNADAQANAACEQADAGFPDLSVSIIPCCDPVASGAFQHGVDTGELWLREPEKKRATLVYGPDQWCVGFLSVIQKAGITCPDDVSVIASCDSTLAQWHYPAITAFCHNSYDVGQMATRLLLDILDGKISHDVAVNKAQNISMEAAFIHRDSLLDLNQAT